MNSEFLNKYAGYQLSDIGEYSEETLNAFVSECSDFLATLKSADHVIWEEVMTMSTSKRSNLMKTILDENADKIIPKTNDQRLIEFENTFEEMGIDVKSPLTEEEIEEACLDMKMSRSEFDNMVSGEIMTESGTPDDNKSNDDNSKLNSVWNMAKDGLKALVRVLKWLRGPATTMDDLLSDRKTARMSAILKTISTALIMFNLGAAVVASSMISMILWSVILIGMIVFIAMGTNWVTEIVDLLRTIGFGIFKIFHRRFGNKTVRGKYTAMYTLETDVKNAREQLHIIRLATMDKIKRDKTPTALDSQRYIKADCLLNCSMRFMITMISELFGALTSCVRNTSGISLKVKGDAAQEIANLKLDSLCEPIRDELYSLTSDFNAFIKLAFKSNTNAANQWRNALNNQIRNVLNGQHSRPVSVKYKSSTTIAPIVFEF